MSYEKHTKFIKYAQAGIIAVLVLQFIYNLRRRMRGETL